MEGIADKKVSFLSMLLYTPKKSQSIYTHVIAHRGWHKVYKENTISAIREAILKLDDINSIAIEIDIRKTKDNILVCFHDRYLKRMFKVYKKMSNLTYKELLKYIVDEKTKDKIPTLEEVLTLVNGKIPILLEIKGYFGIRYKYELLKLLNEYNGDIYFHCKNILSYYKAKKVYKDKVFWIPNIFRKRFNFIKKYK